MDVPVIIEKISEKQKGLSILVDSTGGDTIPNLYPIIAQKNIHIVTPNKKAMSSSLSLYNSIMSSTYPKTESMYYGEATVGAGLPILSTLKDLVETGDEVIKIEGVFSGTLSYIFNEFSKVDGGDVKFSEVVKVAKDQGYTVSRCVCTI